MEAVGRDKLTGRRPDRDPHEFGSLPVHLSVVVPCFNEEGNVAEVVHQAAEIGRALASKLEIIVAFAELAFFRLTSSHT